MAEDAMNANAAIASKTVGKMLRPLAKSVKAWYLENAITNVLAGTVGANHDRIMKWGSWFIALSALGNGAHMAQLVYHYVARMYQLDKNVDETEKTFQVLQAGLEGLDKDVRKVTALVLFLGGVSMVSVGTTAYLGFTLLRKDPAKASNSRSRHRKSRASRSRSRPRARETERDKRTRTTLKSMERRLKRLSNSK